MESSVLQLAQCRGAGQPSGSSPATRPLFLPSLSPIYIQNKFWWNFDGNETIITKLLMCASSSLAHLMYQRSQNTLYAVNFYTKQVHAFIYCPKRCPHLAHPRKSALPCTSLPWNPSWSTGPILIKYVPAKPFHINRWESYVWPCCLEMWLHSWRGSDTPTNPLAGSLVERFSGARCWCSVLLETKKT